MSNFIQLNRTFNVLSEDAQDALSIEIREELLGKETDWDEVLKQPRSVLLAEAGSGKTEEFRNRVKELNKKGEKSFFLYLEELANGHFLPESELNFDEWLQSEDMCYFFLDAVDEAKLKDLRAFETALKVFAQRVRSAFLRVHIVISSRASEWKGKEDLRIVERLLTPNLSEEEMKKGAFSPVIYLLKPLNGAQMLQYAEKRGVNTPETFVDEVWIQGAQDFASRPLELEELISFWQRNGKIGSRKDIVEDSIKRKIREWNEDRAAIRNLSNNKARSGLKTLAFALTMMKRSSFHVAAEHKSDSSVLAGDILQGWAPKEINELLTLPIFSGEAYGRIRFQHRVIREYLAAEKILAMLDSCVSRRDVEALMFCQAYSEEYVVPSLEPVVAWIALHDEYICKRLLDVAPEALIAHGDASFLALFVRKKILNAYACSVAHGRHSKGWFYQPDVYRLASPELSETIQVLYAEYKGNSEIEGLLLQLIFQGKNTDCCFIGYDVALRTEESGDRTLGIRVVSISPDEALKQRFVAEYITSNELVLGDSVLGTMIDELFPSVLSVAALLKLLGTFAPKDEFACDRTCVAMEKAVQRVGAEEERYELVVGLHGLLQKKPYVGDDYCEVSEQHMWLLANALQIFFIDLEKILLGCCLYQTEAVELMRMGVQAKDYGRAFYDSKQTTSVLEQLLCNQQLRMLLFKHVIKKEIQQPNFNVKFVANTCIHMSDLHSEDYIGLIQEFLDTKDMIEKKVLLCAVSVLWSRTEDKNEDELKALFHGVTGDVALENLWEELRTPYIPTDDELRWQKERNERDVRLAEQEMEREQKEKEYVRQLIPQLEKIREADEVVLNDLLFFVNQIKKKGSRLKRAKGDWRDLVERYGAELANAVRYGLIAYWKTLRPVACRSEISSFDYQKICAGLLGIAFQAENNPEWAKSITEDQAKYSVEYALWEINGLPDWLEGVVKVYPAVVDECFKVKIRKELIEGQGNILHDILYHNEFLRERYQGYLIQLLTEEDNSASDFSISYAQDLLLSFGCITQDRLAALAKYAHECAENSNRWLQWLIFLFKVDANWAIAQLEKIFTDKAPEDATICMISVCNAFDSRFESRFPPRFKDYLKVDVLHRLIRLTYRYVNPKDDQHHEGGFSPNARDNAQQARSFFVSMLMGLESKGAYLALQRLAVDLTAEGIQNNFKWCSYELARKNVEQCEWSEDDVCSFIECAEKVPTTLKELYQLCCARLDDIKLNLESGRDSEASLVKAIHEETEVRKWLGKRLESRSMGLYSKVEEEEYADATRPDIQFLNHNIGVPVPVELKIADKPHWSYQIFHERLENQLIGQYMADERHRFGVFLLVNQGKDYWVRPDKVRVGFDTLIAELQEYAELLIANRADIEAITVVGIDLSLRKEEAKLLAG